MPKIFTYQKKEKLKSRKLVEELFAKGKTFTIFPVKIFYLELNNKIDFPAKAGVGASSKNFKKAVHRNRIKRLLREAYRTEKLSFHNFLNEHNKQVAVFLLYVDKTLPDYSIIKNKMPLLLQRLIKELHENASSNT